MSFDELKKLVEAMVQKAADSEKSDDALKFSQSACNSANAIAVLQNNLPKEK